MGANIKTTEGTTVTVKTRRYSRSNAERKCFKCNSTTTGSHTLNSMRKRYQRWYNYKDGYLCSRCYSKSKYIPSSKPRPRPEIKSCHMCKSTISKTSLSGYMIWHFDNNGNRICYSCRLKLAILERRAKNSHDRCDSLICTKSRQTILVRFDYSKYSFCTYCQANHPKSLTFCPCCSRKMRTKPQKTKSKAKALGRPLVYY